MDKMDKKNYSFIIGKFSFAAGRDFFGSKMIHIYKKDTRLGWIAEHPIAGPAFCPEDETCYIDGTLIELAGWVKDYYSIIESPEYAKSLIEWEEKKKEQEKKAQNKGIKNA